MAVYMIDQTAPYTAANGHLMIAPIYLSDREGAEPFKISAEAWCADTCPACGAGDDPEWYAGEVYDVDYDFDKYW